jgi:AraC-like DNA-binding protein
LRSVENKTGSAAVERFAVHTRDPEFAHELIGETYGTHRAWISGSREGFRFSLTTSVVDTVSSDLVRHSTRTRVAVEPLHHLTATHVVAGGHQVSWGRDEHRLAPGDVGLYPYGAGFEACWATMDLGLLRLDFDKVARIAAQTADIDVASFRFLGVRPVSARMGRFWRDMVLYVHRELAMERSTIIHPLVLAQTEMMLVSAVLAAFPNTALTATPRPESSGAGPAALRRAEAYIDAHAGEPITLADIAADAGVSARALQQGFAGHRGTTPMGYLRRVRLERAHRELQAADPTRGDTVGQIALNWGFAKSSRFAALYRGAYGVNPARTLNT